MEKLNYTALERYGELMRDAEGCLAGVWNAMHGAYPDNGDSPRGLDAKGYAVELRAIVIDLEREVRKLDAMTGQDADAMADANWDHALTQEAGQ